MSKFWSNVHRHINEQDANCEDDGGEVMAKDWTQEKAIEALEAENARLRAALEEVKALVFGANHSETRYPLARAALEGK